MAFEFLKSLFRTFESKVVHDDFLGSIANDRFGNWSGSKHFGPTNSEVSFSIRTGDNPPTAQQIAFVRDVEMRFPAVWADLRTKLFAELDDFADGTTMEQLFDSLKVESLMFWDLVGEPYHWEISCTTPKDDHVFGIEMRGFENQGFRMDG